MVVLGITYLILDHKYHQKFVQTLFLGRSSFLFHHCIVLFRYVVCLVLHNGVFFQIPITFLNWCGFSFYTDTCSPSILVRWMFPAFSDESIIGVPYVHLHIIGPHAPLFFPWCCCINSSHWMSIIFYKVITLLSPTNIKVNILKSYPEIVLLILIPCTFSFKYIIMIHITRNYSSSAFPFTWHIPWNVCKYVPEYNLL